ncbi:MAG: lytic murein transglycosylase [Bdellovibrionales bacterium]
MTAILPALILSSLLAFPAFAKGVAGTPPSADWKFAEKRMIKAGLEKDFIAALKESYDPDPFSEVLELNTLLFLKKSDYHGVQVNGEAAVDVRNFMTANKESLAIAQKTYHVPGGVVASLLWMESRHGKNLGQFHVPSVFVDLVQADRPQVIKYLHKAGKRFTAQVTKKNKRDITSRAKKRVMWAISELKAIQKMYRQNPKALPDFRGSFAGAFGMAQFEPSSYVHYAKSQSGDHPAILEHADDAIQSVAYYLHQSGWHMSKQKSYVKALMRYNNSHDYASAILKLARQADPDDANLKRLPAGSKRRPKSRRH